MFNIGEEANGRVLSANRFEKWCMSAGVQRIPVKEGNIRGTLFLPLAQAHFQVCQLNYTTVHKCTILLQYCKNGACSGTLKQQNDFSQPHHDKLIDQQALICILTQ